VRVRASARAIANTLVSFSSKLTLTLTLFLYFYPTSLVNNFNLVLIKYFCSYVGFSETGSIPEI